MSVLFRPGFLEFYRQGHFADVTILTNTKSYKAHRLILSFSSAFFEAMFLSEFQETQTAVIDLTKTYDPHNVFPEILRFMYSGRIELNIKRVVPLLAMADILLIKTLYEKCMDFISTHLNKTTALNFLLDAIDLHQEQLAQNCLKVLASSFLHICDDIDLSGLDGSHFLQLICHPRLAVNNEWKLFKVIFKYLHFHKITNYPDPDAEKSDLILNLFKNVRFYFFNFEQLTEAAKMSVVPKDLLVEPLLARLQPHEAPELPISNLGRSFQPRASCGIMFEVGDSKEKLQHGIIHWLGTKQGSAPWVNPAAAGLVNIYASSLEKGHPHSLVELEPQELWTHDVPASWLSVDLGKFRVLPHAYMLRHGGNYRADSLRNWDFQGSLDGKTWVVLKRHSNDPTLSAPFAVKTFTVDKAQVPYQWFRIIQTGHNSTNHNFLVLSGFELYGELWSADAYDSKAV